MKGTLVAISLLFLWNLAARTQPLVVPRNLQHTYTKGTRSVDGRPGKNYWQNSADYSIDIRFNPDTRLISGVVEILYVNNSPDTLKQVLFKLYPNLYKKGSLRDRNIDPSDVSDGVVIDSFQMNGRSMDVSRLNVDGTNMNLARQQIAPKRKTSFRITYHYTLNKGSHIRTGEVEPHADFIAYFFPRVAVYDDVDGWNRIPYSGSQEFYNDFCNFDVRITVPRNFIVWATGNLLNCGEVLQPKFCERISRAETSDEILTIIDTTDDKLQITTNATSLSWHYRAEEVPDFAFATSDHYMWQSTSLEVDPLTKRRTRVDAVFNPKHHDYFEVVSDARKTIDRMSYAFPAWPFPYPHATVFDGLDQMEYPMMFNDNPVEDRFESIELTVHEVFHTMFPFYTGINETKYGWMDEGWATIGEWLISPMIDTALVDEYGVQPYSANAGTEADLPIMTLTTQESGTTMFLNSYPKPAFAYLYLRDMLGDSLFRKALHFYIGQWKGKHPMPFDFFNCINTGSGKNLNWFWRRWFFEGGYPDLAISSVTEKIKSYSVLITSKGTKPVPIDLTVTFADKTIAQIHYPVSVWEKGNTTFSIAIPGTKRIESISLGSSHVPDVNKADNYFTVKPKR